MATANTASGQNGRKGDTMTMNRDEQKTAHGEQVLQAEAAAIREAAILNAAAKCLEVDDPFEGFNSHMPEDPILSIAQRGHRAQFDWKS